MDHLKQIASRLPEYGLDAMVIVSQPGEYYAVGFYGEGRVLVTAAGSWYFTDSRYIEAARSQVAGAAVEQVSAGMGHRALAARVIREQGLHRVGYESGYTSVDAMERLKRDLPCELVGAQGLLDGLRAAKDRQEQQIMRKAQAITDRVFSGILDFIRPGMTEREVAARLVYDMMRFGASKPSFDPIVAAGPNGSMPHAVPGDTVIEPGMFVTMDFGCIYRGYCSDMTRTVAVGEPSEEMRRVYGVVLQAQQAGIAAARAGIPGSQVDQAGRAVIDQAGYGAQFGHSFGHSLGLEIHESPNFSPGETAILPVGAVVSAEPGIYLPGRFGVRIEDVVILDEEGCEDITQSPRELIVL